MIMIFRPAVSGIFVEVLFSAAIMGAAFLLGFVIILLA